MKLILVAPNPLLWEAFREHFNHLPNVEVVNDYFEWLPEFDCMVSPANSFGLMDGGIDAAIIRFFGQSLMDRVQQRILEEYLGEQPVGTSFIVETGHSKHPFLAHTPTMRVPMIVAGTDIPYVAMWAMLLAVRRHNQQAKHKIHTIACPGLGTGIGRVPYPEAARMMALAYDHFLYPPKLLNCFVAGERQLQIWEEGNLGVTERRHPPQTVL
ncbi:macro domain-containing protein [Allocoleopsis franciscana]|uniref:macro domain-containing protein n=1 Tax=Allocoleopsis franciscana TaxID=2886352 RepID=UPI0003074325|nr:macro domain-containing protein [Allocoleopsis franciscana]